MLPLGTIGVENGDMMLNTDLIEALEQVRERSGWTDSEFSDELGINRTTLWWIRTRQRPPSMRVLTAILWRFPELTPQVTLFLQSNVPHSDSKDSDRDTNFLVRKKAAS